MSIFTLDFASGGQVVIDVCVDLWALSESDRDFIFEIVDKVETARCALTRTG